MIKELNYLKMEYDLTALNDNPHVCEECGVYKKFGAKCWYFWDRKKTCSQKLNGKI